MPRKGKQVAPQQDFKVYRGGTINNFNRFHLLAQDDEDRCEDWWHDEDDDRDEDGEDNNDDKHEDEPELDQGDDDKESHEHNNVDEHEVDHELSQAGDHKQGHEQDQTDHHKQDELHKGDENHREDRERTQDATQPIDSHQSLGPCRLLEMPGEIKNRIYHYAVMVPSSTQLPLDTKHSEVQPWIPNWKGATNLLLLNRVINEEAKHLLNDKPNRVTLHVWQPMEIQEKQPVLAGCKTKHTSWATRAYTFEQVSCMNDLTIRIPYFEWRYWPDHVVHQGNYDHNTHSKLGRLGWCRFRHPIDIQEQLHTLAAAASRNPNLKRLTLAFRRMNGRSRDDAEPDHWMYKKIQEKLEKFVRFRGSDFDIRAISYELPNAGDSVLDRVEVLAPWFNAARADWVRRVKEESAADSAPDGPLPEETLNGQGESGEEGGNSSTNASKDSNISDDSWGCEYDRVEAARVENYIQHTTVNEFSTPGLESLREHTESDHDKGWYPCRGQGVSKGRDHRCIYCHRDVRDDWSNKEFPMLYTQHCDDGDEWLGKCEATKHGRHCYPKLWVSDDF